MSSKCAVLESFLLETLDQNSPSPLRLSRGILLLWLFASLLVMLVMGPGRWDFTCFDVPESILEVPCWHALEPLKLVEVRGNARLHPAVGQVGGPRMKRKSHLRILSLWYEELTTCIERRLQTNECINE